ncbi:hypothetical protein [Catenulispora pinisilvae]|uniref:hypothetical protein n=1 Tax=Catenulispora pinisilvae TaxID=2705253 RepID=UPI001891299C|nr:hypothetical protein [Catenulispora pinisilvae]
MNSSKAGRRSASWFQKGCTYFALGQLTGIEVLPAQRRASVQVAGTTLHGTPSELRLLATRLHRAASLAESAS